MKSIEDLERIRQKAKEETRLREGGQTVRISVMMGTCGIAAGARETLAAILQELRTRNLSDVLVTQKGCIGMCDKEPLIEVEKPGLPTVTYAHVTPERAKQIIARHVVNGVVVSDWAIAER